MKKQTGSHSTAAHVVRNQAEGSPDKTEREEPRSPLRTSTIPAIDVTIQHPAFGETGLIPVVKLHETDDNSDRQDASLTQDETAFDFISDTDANRMNDTVKDTPVLVVEDTVELAEVIQATLEGIGMQVDYATHGKMGLEKLKTMNPQPQVLLLDIGLPDITGWKLLDGVKEYYESNKLPLPKIIVITAYGDPANRLIGKLQNIYTYLIKPFTPDQVERVVTQALRGEAPDEPSISG